MIQRNSKEVSFQGGNQVAQYTQAGGGYKGPEVQRTTGDGGAAATSNLVQNILKDADSYFKTGIQVSREEAYLDGAAKAASGEAEEALESNIITKDWATAGYRDTVGKLKMADLEATLAIDMKRLRGDGPEAMRDYLAQRRSQIQPSLDGMSREQRVSSFGQMLTSDRAAIALHASEHTKFIIEQKITAKQAEEAVSYAALENARKSSDPDTYNAVALKYVTDLTGSILNEPSFDPKMKQEMFVQAVEKALSTGNTQVYDMLNSQKIPKDIANLDKGEVSIMGSLSYENQTKLSNAYRSASDRFEGARTMDLHNEVSFAMADMNKGTYGLGIDGVKALQSKIMRMTNGTGIAMADKVMQHYLEQGSKVRPNTAAIAANVVAGRFSSNTALGIDETEGLEIAQKEWVKAGKSFSDQNNILMGMVQSHSSQAAAKMLGKNIGGVVRSLDMNKPLAVNDAEALATTMAKVETFTAAGDTVSLGHFYAGMPEEAATRIKRLLASGVTTKSDVAINAVREIEKMDSVDPGTRAVIKAANTKALQEYKSNITPMGQWERFKSFLPFFGKTREQRNLSPETSLWTSSSDNGAILQEYIARTDATLQEEGDAYHLSHPNARPEDVVKAAEEGALRRTVQVGGGLLQVPFGTDPMKYFGIDGKRLIASPEQLGKAIEAVTPKLDPTGRMTYIVDGNTIIAKEYKADGSDTINTFRIDRKEVETAVKAQMDNRKEMFNKASGFGIAVPVGKVSLRINGQNTAAMDDNVMVDIRESLVKYEGFDAVPKQDVGKQKDKEGKDITTVGIGISSTNTFYKRAVEAKTPEEHLAVFRDATNEAATSALKLVKQHNLQGNAWKQLATELTYQSGSGNVRELDSYRKLFACQEPADMIELMEKTPAYTMSQPSRQRHYRSLIQRASRQE